MMANRMQKKWEPNPLVAKCRICDSPADHVKHFGATACYSCRAFFQRTIKNGKEYKMCVRKTDSCIFDAVTRTNCKKCRYQKCLLVGMKVGKLKKVNCQDKQTSDKTANKPEEKSEKTITVEEIQIVNLLLETESDNTFSQNSFVDINSLVEECFSEEFVPCEDYSGNKNTFGISSEMPFKWTHDEEFKIYELIVRKEMVLDTCFKTLFQLPKFLEACKKSLLSLCNGEGYSDAFQKLCDKSPRFVDHHLARDGSIRQFLDMFEKVDENVKTEVLQFTLPIFRVCSRALVMGNKDKAGFVEQHIAAGVYNNTFKEVCETIFPQNGCTIRAYDPFSIGQFTSPWAVNYDDEVFFLSTLKTLANIVKDDVNLGTLFLTLLLSTPGAKLTELTKRDLLLQKIQDSVKILLYRYLRNKYDSDERALDTSNNLMRLLGDLHICREIFMFSRLPVDNEELFDASIEELEIHEKF